jgi:hypothetical protein
MNASRWSRRILLRTASAAAVDWVIGAPRSPAAAAEASPGPSPLDSVKLDPATLAGREGFWRVGKSTAGRWWLVRPDGRPFLYRGVVSVGAFNPPADDVEARAQGKNLNRHAYWLKRLGDMGFNGLGAWTPSDMFDRGWPYTVLIHVRKITGNKWTVQPPKHIDVFDPAWRAAYDEKCKEICTPLRDKKDLLGYFIDNEAFWAQARKDHVWEKPGGDQSDKNVAGKEPLLLQYYLALPPERGGHKATWDFVLKRHGGGIQQLAKDWGVEFDSPAKFAELHAKKLVLYNKSYAEDLDAFTTYFAREYFRVTSEIIRKHDPNHLLLGCRHGGPPGDVVLKAYDPRHCDVLSFNNYRPNFRERADEYRLANLPMLNTEFAWQSGHWKRPNTRTSPPEAVEAFRRLATAAVENAFTHPNLVGYSWFKFGQPNFDLDAPHEGLFNSKMEMNRFNAYLLTKINPRLEGIAAGQIKPQKA